MIVIVDHAMPKDGEESKEAVVKTVKVIRLSKKTSKSCSGATYKWWSDGF